MRLLRSMFDVRFNLADMIFAPLVYLAAASGSLDQFLPVSIGAIVASLSWESFGRQIKRWEAEDSHGDNE